MNNNNKIVAALASAIAAEAKAETLKEILLSEEQKSQYEKLFKTNLIEKTDKVIKHLGLSSEELKTKIL